MSSRRLGDGVAGTMFQPCPLTLCTVLDGGCEQYRGVSYCPAPVQHLLCRNLGPPTSLRFGFLSFSFTWPTLSSLRPSSVPCVCAGSLRCLFVARIRAQSLFSVRTHACLLTRGRTQMFSRSKVALARRVLRSVSCTYRQSEFGVFLELRFLDSYAVPQGPYSTPHISHLNRIHRLSAVRFPRRSHGSCSCTSYVRTGP